MRFGLAILAASLACGIAPASAYTTIFAFGDSLSDAGNISILDGGTDPVSPPYFDGHFSNGRTWVEDLSRMLGLGALKPSLAGGHDFAYGGAQTGPTAIEGVNPGDLLGQVATYAAFHRGPEAGALYTIDIGGNDIINALGELEAGKISLSVVSSVVADGDLPRRSVEILRDLGLSKEKIVAYHRRFPTPTPTTGEPRRHRQGERQNAAHK
jgi:phospholipase/lecithinase/hemolysin